MFTNTAYEAMYEYLGLALHAQSINIITSQKIFAAVILLTFGYLFFSTAAHFFSRYIPGILVQRKSIALSKFVKITACLILGTSLLKVGATTSIHDYHSKSWSGNPYIQSKVPNVQTTYQVSFIFDLLSRSAEELAALISRVVDDLFKTTNSQLDAPDFFFKSIMYAGAASFSDPKIQQNIRLYTEECFDRALPYYAQKKSYIEKFYVKDPDFDSILQSVVIDPHAQVPFTCLDLKNTLLNDIVEDGHNKKYLDPNITQYSNKPYYTPETAHNIALSEALVRHYTSEHEGAMGIQTGSQIPTTSGRIFQYIKRVFSIDGWLPNSFQGAFVSASRSQEFSENIARAHHVAGFIKMICIFIFPWLIFPVVAGYWRVLYYWLLVYTSVLLWAPMWTLLYHIMSGIALSSDMMESFKDLNGGISLYSAELVTSRIYHLYAVYAWLQLLTGGLLTIGVLWFLRSGNQLNDTISNDMNDVTPGASTAIGTATKVVGAL